MKAGVPTKVVQERLGHSSPLITMKLYQHVMPGMGRDAADLVASMIFGLRVSVYFDVEEPKVRR